MIHGENPILLSVNYIKPVKEKTDMYGNTIPKVEESFEVIYKTEDGRVYKTNEEALVDIYFVKPEYRSFDYNKPQEKIEHLEKRRVLYSKILWEIATEIGDEGIQFFRNNVNSRDWRALEKLYGWRFAFACDFQPEFYFMKQWYDKYPLRNVKLTKAYIDIETDMMDYSPDLEKLSGTTYAPVNCATVILEDTRESHTFILRPYVPSRMTYGSDDAYNIRYNLYVEQLKQHNDLLNNMDDFIRDLNESFDSTYGDIKYHVREYEEEIELIAGIFKLLNDRKPNFCLAWNMRFDIQYLLERIKTLGYEPTSVMCHPDFENPKYKFHVDRFFFKIEEQHDYFLCSSYTQYICQMRNYAAIRKSQQMLKSLSLNAIAERELKDRKIEYEDETNITYFPYVDWKRFTKYNIKDVLLQLGIERKTNDVMTYYMKSHSNLTHYSKIFRETHLLRNVRELYFNKDGWVQSNNLNVIGKDDKDLFYSVDSESSEDDNESTFKGALVADPIWNDKVGMMIFDAPSNVVYDLVIDEDMTAFYPSIKIASNMDPGTLVAKAEIDTGQFMSGEYQNRSLNTVYEEKDKNGKIRKTDITGEIINTFVSENVLTFCYNYLSLPSITELVRTVKKELKV